MTLKNTENALITINSRQKGNGGENEINFTVPGTYRITEQAIYIAYNEPEKIGTDCASVLVKTENGRVTVRRRGEFHGVMEYIQNAETEFVYHTPYGGITMQIAAEMVNVSLSRNGGKIKLCYKLISGGETSENEFGFDIAVQREE